MKYLTLAIITLLLIAACGVPPTREAMDNELQSYIGLSIATLIHDIGNPETTHEVRSGRDYVFRKEIIATGPYSYSSIKCTLNVHSNDDGIITSIDQSGRKINALIQHEDICAYVYLDHIQYMKQQRTQPSQTASPSN